MEIGDIRHIEKEKWKKAKGVVFKKGDTNPIIAKRDYSISCKPTHQICCINGFFLWWCSAHHQPHTNCKIAIMGLDSKSQRGPMIRDPKFSIKTR